MKKLILIGDSIRFGYQDTVAAELQGWAELQNPSENGGTSANVLAHLDEWALSLNPDIVQVNAGLHDLGRWPELELATKISIADYASNVREILGKLQQTGALVLWARTTPVIDERHRVNKPFERRQADVAAFNAVADGIADELGIAINDLYQLIMDHGPEELLGADGVHFNEAGKVLLGKAVAAFIREQAVK